MGIPEMKELWDSLTSKYADGSISKTEQLIYRKWGNALKYLSMDPNYPGLQTHEISPLTKRYGIKVWQSYLENRKSSPMRMYWVYGPGKMDITVIGLEPQFFNDFQPFQAPSPGSSWIKALFWMKIRKSVFAAIWQ